MKRASSSLRRLFTRSSPASPSNEYAQVLERLQALDSKLTAFASRPIDEPRAAEPTSDERLIEQLEAVQQSITAVEKQIQRSGREQLKVNALVEAQQEQTRSALEALDVAAARRDEEIATTRQQIVTAQANARLDVVRQLLPVLDGLDEALRAGEDILGTSVAPQRALTLFERMRARESVPTFEEQRLRDALRSWLHGLTFVRQRMLDMLAAEQVRPIDALHGPFDPQLHIALQAFPATPATPPGTVVAVMRSGYTIGERILRHAEVAVAQEWERSEQGSQV